MRRVGAIAVCVAALFFAGGCGDESTPSTATSSAAPPAATTAAASPSGASKKEVCDQVKAINAQYTGQITTTFQKMTDQMVKGDQEGAKKTLDELNAQTGEWAKKIEPLVAQTDDPQLKSALQNLLDGVKKLQSGNGSMQDMQKLVTDANSAIAKYCA
jgi:hypothetical protein